MEITDHEIGNFKLLPRKMEALEALALLPVLGRVVSAAASRLDGVDLSAFADVEEDAEEKGLAALDLDFAGIAPAFTELFIQLDASDLPGLAFKLLRRWRVTDRKANDGNGKVYEIDTPADLDKVFADSLDDFLKVLTYSVKFNFASYFSEGLMQKVAALGRASKATEESP
jgi:hypothetical protein